MPPGATHWLGTDDVGRDIFSRLIFGAPASLFGSLFAAGIAIAIGLPVGLFSGYVGGWIDDVIGRIIDTLLSFTAIVLAIGVTGALGIHMVHAMFAIGLVFSPLLARLPSTQTLQLKNVLHVQEVHNTNRTAG